nr:putative immunity function [Saccharomycopsis selenospora]
MIYEESPSKSFDKLQVLKFHVHAYYGELELFKNYVSSEIISNFLETSCYCISEGCKKNFDFAKFCKNNISFLNKDYYNSIAIGYILAGEWEDDIILDVDIISPYLYNISNINLSKICVISQLRDLSAYLCILKQNKGLFDTIINPSILNITKLLLENFKLDNYFKEVINFNPNLSICDLNEISDFDSSDTPELLFVRKLKNLWFPKHYKLDFIFCETDFNYDMFGHSITFDSLEYAYGPQDMRESILELTNIRCFEKFIYYNEFVFTDKEVNKHNIIEDVRVCRKAQKEGKYINLVKCKSFLLTGVYDDLSDNTFLSFINDPYDYRLIPYVSEHHKWSIIYSIVKCNFYVSNILDDFDYIEYNSVIIAIKVGNTHFNNLFKYKFNEGYKCYKMIDYDNELYFDKQEVEIHSLYEN